MTATPTPETLDIVLSVCALCLERPQGDIKPEDGFLALGGTSIQAFMVNTALEQKLAERLPPDGLPVTAIIQQPTLSAFAACIDDLLWQAPAEEEGVL